MTSRTEPRQMSLVLNRCASRSPRSVPPPQCLTFHRQSRSPCEFQERINTRACGQRAATKFADMWSPSTAGVDQLFYCARLPLYLGCDARSRTSWRQKLPPPAVYAQSCGKLTTAGMASKFDAAVTPFVTLKG